MLFNFGAKHRMRKVIEKIHGQIMAAVRQPEFYRDYGVADTFEGRFELLCLHAALVLRRLQQMPAPGPAIAKALADRVFTSLDAALREMGVGDTVLPKRMGRLLEAFSGRMLAYGRALEPGDAELAPALVRNILGGQGSGVRLEAYALSLVAMLEQLDLPAVELQGINFPNAANVAAAEARSNP